jgi:hypothetical protein
MEFMMPPDVMSIDSDISKSLLTLVFILICLDKIGALTPSPFTDNIGGFDSFTMTGANMNRGHALGTYYAGGINQLGQYGGNISPSYMLQNHH